MRELRFTAAFALVALLAARPAGAGPYPVNVCVGRKQQLAASYCNSALAAWSSWETKQDAARRDDALEVAAGRLAGNWGDADAKALAKGTDCADTTLSATAAVSRIDSAIGALVGTVNDGLDLSQREHARCGAKLLKASAAKCAALLQAEARYVEKPAKDPHATKRDEARTKASDKFAHDCGTARKPG